MLGILLTILKIIGIILLVLIGLILLAAAVILLVPIRYHGEGAREEKILSGNVKLTWLLHMISASASLSEDGTKIRVCLFGKTIYPKTKKPPKKSKAKKMPKQEATKKSEKSEKPKQQSDTVSKEVATIYEPQKPNPELPKKEKKNVYEAPEAKKMDEPESEKKQQSQKEKSARPDVKSKFEDIKQKLLAVKEKFIDSKAGIQKIKNKIDYWKNLLTSDPMKEAMEFLWKKTKGLLHHILPRRMTGRIHFGFEDPSKTGKTLAYFSMLYPFTKENLVIEPEFETEELILEGDIAFRGRIRLGYLVYVALSVVLNKNIRRQYKRLRQGGNKDGDQETGHGRNLKGLEGFVSSKTVVGEPIQVNDATIIPLVDMKFGMGAGAFKKNSDNKTAGGIGANISPCAVLIIQKGMAKVVNIKNQDLTTKIVDMVPDLINRFTSKKADDPAVDEAVDDILNDDKK